MSDLDIRIQGTIGLDAYEAITRVITGAAVTQTSITAVTTTAPSTFGKTGIGASFSVGDIITVTGFANPANNGTFEIASKGADTLVVTATTIVGSGTGGVVKKNATMAVSGIGAYFTPGQRVIGVGFANAGNNRLLTVAAVSANSISVDAINLTTESAGAGIVKRAEYLDALVSVRGMLGEADYIAALAVAVP